MGLKNNKFKILSGIILLTGCVILVIMNLLSNSGEKIIEWNNYYNEDNIVFFYEENSNEKLKKLSEEYKLQEELSDCSSEFDKVLKAVSIVDNMLSLKDIKNSELNNGYDILKMKSQSHQVSFRDMAIVARDFVNSMGVKSRIGFFRKGESKYHSEIDYYVLEYWSNDYNKWIMIDFTDAGYFENEDTKLSALEVINSDIKKIFYMGQTSQIDYKNKVSKFFDSYTISIENSNEKKRSNCNVTYIKNENALEYKVNGKFMPPTVFTKESRLFEKSPFNKLVGDDEKAYMLICGSITDKTENKEKKDKAKDKLYIAAFQSDSVLESFYLRINGSEYEEVECNKEIELEKGNNLIELSIDGKNTVSSINIEKK
ncbi:MAG: hypothetical protein ACI398_02160 [Clostridium sp.]